MASHNVRRKMFVPALEVLEGKILPSALPWPVNRTGADQPVFETYGQYATGGQIHLHAGTDAMIPPAGNHSDLVSAVESGRIVRILTPRDTNNFYQNTIVVTSLDGTHGWIYAHVTPGSNPYVNPRRPWQADDEVTIGDVLGVVANVPPAGSNQIAMPVHVHLDYTNATNDNSIFMGLRTPIDDPRSYLQWNDNVAPTLDSAKINFRLAADDVDGTTTPNQIPADQRVTSETARDTSHYFRRRPQRPNAAPPAGYLPADYIYATPVGAQVSAYSAVAGATEMQREARPGPANANIDIIAAAYDQAVAGSNWHLGVNSVGIHVQSKNFATFLPYNIPSGPVFDAGFSFNGQFLGTIRDNNFAAGPVQSYFDFFKYNLVRTIYEHDWRSDSQNGTQFWYTLTNNSGGYAGTYSEDGGVTEIPYAYNSVRASDRSSAWFSNIAVYTNRPNGNVQTNMWNTPGATIAANNAAALFPDDYYTITLRASDAWPLYNAWNFGNQSNPLLGNRSSVQTVVLLKNYAHTLTTNTGSLYGSQDLVVTGGQGFRANQNVTLYVLSRAPQEGMPLAPAAILNGTITVAANADGVLRNTAVSPTLVFGLTPGSYYIVADYNGDGYYTSLLDPRAQFIIIRPPVFLPGIPHDAKVGQFVDPNGPGNPSDYAATIDWGDGHTSAGIISINANNQIEVSGQHTYATSGQFVAQVQISNSTDGFSDSGTNAIEVDPAPLLGLGNTIVAAEGQLVGDSLASFVFTNTNDSVENYAATIDWGDGATSAGVLTPNGSGGFDVAGDHAYLHTGVYQPVISVSDGAANSYTANAMVEVADGALTPGDTNDFSTQEGNGFAGTVATFQGENPYAAATDFTATVGWGDGTTSTGTVVQNSDHSFSVLGSHTYEEGGFYRVVTTIQDAGGESVDVGATANVLGRTVYASGATIAAVEGQDTAAQLATFVDPYTDDSDTSYVAAVDWGDGTETAADVVNVSGNTFAVRGEHNYVTAGTYTVTVEIYNSVNSSATVTSVVNVHPPVVARDDTVETVQSVAVDIHVLANDSGDGIWISSLQQPEHGTALLHSGQATITYTPEVGGDPGEYTFWYTITDVYGATATASVTVTVGEPQLAEGGTVTPNSDIILLSDAELQAAVALAERQVAHDLGIRAVIFSGALDFRLAQLQNGILAITNAEKKTIWIDQSGAGYGWFTDGAAASDSAFGPVTVGQDRLAIAGTAAVGKMDLLTVVEHELAHVLGYHSVDVSILPHALMSATLASGVRRITFDQPLAPLAGASGEMPALPASVADAAFGNAALPVLDTKLFSSGWLLDKRAPLEINGATVEPSMLLPEPVYQLPARASALDPKAPALVVDSSAELPLAAGPRASADLLPAVRQGASTDDVLLGGEGDDLVIGGDGLDFAIGGFASTVSLEVAEWAGS